MVSIEELSKLSGQSDCSYVYGSRFAARPLPSHQLPDGGTPKDVAYQLIKDDLTLDGQPILKSVSISQVFKS
jgi:glutamate decarboxylase